MDVASLVIFTEIWKNTCLVPTLLNGDCTVVVDLLLHIKSTLFSCLPSYSGFKILFILFHNMIKMCRNSHIGIFLRPSTFSDSIPVPKISRSDQGFLDICLKMILTLHNAHNWVNYFNTIFQ